MRRSRWAVLSFLFALTVAGAAAAAAKDSDKTAKDSDKKGKAGAEKPSNLPPGVTLNACGCYTKGNGCVCTNKKAKCECPGECEPAGCDVKRNKAKRKLRLQAEATAERDASAPGRAVLERLTDAVAPPATRAPQA